MTYNDRLNVIEGVSKKLKRDDVRFKTAMHFDKLSPRLTCGRDSHSEDIKEVVAAILSTLEVSYEQSH